MSVVVIDVVVVTAVAVAVAVAVVAAVLFFAVTRWLKLETKFSDQQNWRICSLRPLPFPLHFFRALPLPACFTTEQSTVEASLFVKQESTLRSSTNLSVGISNTNLCIT